MNGPKRWALPYVDQPQAFWEWVLETTSMTALIYCPMPDSPIGTGRPPQPQRHLGDFLKNKRIPKSLLLNPITLPAPVEDIAHAVIAALRRLTADFEIEEAVVTNLTLAQRIRDALPGLRLAASTLADLAMPQQAVLADNLFEVITPPPRIMRDASSLARFRNSWAGRVRLIVNESCLAGCPFRTQHFQEMNSNLPHPQSLCNQLLEKKPWLRMTGAWILPQHLHLFDGLYDELKLAGRVTLQDPEKYRRVLGAYVNRTPLLPDEIGGGPASPLLPIHVDESFYAYTLHCNKECAQCNCCRDYYAAGVSDKPSSHTGRKQEHGRAETIRSSQ